MPIVFAEIKLKDPQSKSTTIKVLLDSGASATLISEKWASKLSRLIPNEVTRWTTSAGTFETKEKAIIQMIFAELHESKTITCNAHIAPNLGAYDVIVGREILKELGITLCFKNETIEWDEVIIPMKSEDATPERNFAIADSATIDEATERLKTILDAKYQAADISQIAANSSHLSHDEQTSLFKSLQKYKNLFDGTLGTWNDEEYQIELKPDAKPYHARAYPIPKMHKVTLKLEVQRLCNLGVLKKVNRSEWAAPTFVIPKKDGTVCFISDFRQLNLRIKRKPFPIPKIQDLLLKLEGFQYATSLDQYGILPYKTITIF